MPFILDFASDSPALRSDSLSIPIPLTPVSQGLSALFLSIPQGALLNRIELKATAGICIVHGAGDLVFRMYRGRMQVFNARMSLHSQEVYPLATLYAVDANVPAGAHEYTLCVELVSGHPDAEVRIIGPLTFSGFAVGL